MRRGAPGAILGVSFGYHDAAAAVVVDGELVAAAEEERFTRRKHDSSLPEHAIAWCLESAGIGGADLGGVAFYDKPLTTYERILSTHARVGPRGFGVLTRALSEWTRSKLWVGPQLEGALGRIDVRMPQLTYVEHHLSHAASAFYPSPFGSAAVLTLDGVGEWTTSSVGHGTGHRLRLVEELVFPDSVGLLYSALTSFCGFEVNDGEYKLMGLAPYGEPRYVTALRDQVVSIAEDGSIRLDQRWFDYRAGTRMTRPALAALLDGPAAEPGAPPGQREADIARSVQDVLEEVVLRMGRHAHHLTGERAVCLAGGVALNCVANARLRDEGPFEDVWVQPAAGDAGGAVGAALWEFHQHRGAPRVVRGGGDGMSGSFLGPAFADDEVHAWLTAQGVAHERYDDAATVAAVVADHLAAGRIVGWFQGRMEFGPRALGHRSILADPRDPAMVARLNQRIKGREGFRPFAPAVLEEHLAEWFDLDRPSPYMLFTAGVRPRSVADEPTARRGASDAASFAQRLAEVRSDIPACTHVDGSARVQTVGPDNPELRSVLEAFHRRSGCPVLLNTSFNSGGDPIVRTPADALECFRRTGLDVLAIERCVIVRTVDEPVTA